LWHDKTAQDVSKTSKFLGRLKMTESANLTEYFVEELLPDAESTSTYSTHTLDAGFDLYGDGVVMVKKSGYVMSRIPSCELEDIQEPRAPTSGIGDFLITLEVSDVGTVEGVKSIRFIYGTDERIDDRGNNTLIARYVSLFDNGHYQDTHQPMWHLQSTPEEGEKVMRYSEPAGSIDVEEVAGDD
jgi:hypothetical protein